MEKKEFIEKIKAELADFGEIVVQEVNRATTSYTGLLVRAVGVPTPVVNIDKLYTKYCKDEYSMQECVNAAREILNMKMETDFNPKDITEWSKVKSKLYLRLLGTPGKGVYREVEDMYLVPYIRVSSDDSATARVVPEMLEAWDIDEETLFEQAKANQEIMRPARITRMSERLGLPDEAIPLYIISTDTEINGASAILYEGVADRVRNMIGDFYILPSSIHEVIVVPKSYRDDIEALSEMVKMVNSESVAEEDRLTNSVYAYDFDANTIRKVG